MLNSKVAVILVNYNGIADTVECIKSLQSSESYNELTIVVVDNASNRNEADDIKAEFPDVITIRSETNGGFSAGNNLGIKWALDHQYGYIMILNNDTVIAPDMIKILKRKCNPETVVAPKMLYYSNPETIWYGGGTINKKTGNAEHSYMNQKDPCDTLVQKCDFATGCCLMIPSSIFRKVGLLDEKFFMYCEDTEFCLRLKENGIGINYVPTAKLWHKISQSTGGDESAFSIYYMTRNRILCIKEHRKEFAFTALAFTVVTRIIRMLQMRLKGKPEWKAFQEGIRDGLKGITGKR